MKRRVQTCCWAVPSLMPFVLVLVAGISSADADSYTNRPAVTTCWYSVDTGTWIGNAIRERRIVHGITNLALPAHASRQSQLTSWKAAVVAVCSNFVDVNTGSNGNYDAWFQSVQVGYADNTNAYQNPTRFKKYSKYELGNQLGVATNFFEVTPWLTGQAEWKGVTSALARLVHTVPTNSTHTETQLVNSNYSSCGSYAGQWPEFCTGDSAMDFTCTGQNGSFSFQGPGRMTAHYGGLKAFRINNYPGYLVHGAYYAGNGSASYDHIICGFSPCHWYENFFMVAYYTKDASMTLAFSNTPLCQVDLYMRYSHLNQTDYFGTISFPPAESITYATLGCDGFTSCPGNGPNASFQGSRALLGSTYGMHPRFHLFETATSASATGSLSTVTFGPYSAFPEWNSSGYEQYQDESMTCAGVSYFEQRSWLMAKQDVSMEAIPLARWNVSGGFAFY